MGLGIAAIVGQSAQKWVGSGDIAAAIRKSTVGRSYQQTITNGKVAVGITIVGSDGTLDVVGNNSVLDSYCTGIAEYPSASA